MITTTSESDIQVAMEGSAKGFDSILMDAIFLLKNATKFWYLFTNPERYLTRATQESLEEGENF
jgi:hypothetical protein